MNEYDSERSKTWNIYTSSNPSPSQPGMDREAPWKNFGTSMNAISFGFVATAILISMFLIMAIFEHLFRPTASFSSTEDMNGDGSLESGTIDKLRNLQAVSHLPSEFLSFVFIQKIVYMLQFLCYCLLWSMNLSLAFSNSVF